MKFLFYPFDENTVAVRQTLASVGSRSQAALCTVTTWMDDRYGKTSLAHTMAMRNQRVIFSSILLRSGMS